MSSEFLLIGYLVGLVNKTFPNTLFQVLGLLEKYKRFFFSRLLRQTKSSRWSIVLNQWKYYKQTSAYDFLFSSLHLLWCSILSQCPLVKQALRIVMKCLISLSYWYNSLTPPLRSFQRLKLPWMFVFSRSSDQDKYCQSGFCWLLPDSFSVAKEKNGLLSQRGKGNRAMCKAIRAVQLTDAVDIKLHFLSKKNAIYLFNSEPSDWWRWLSLYRCQGWHLETSSKSGMFGVSQCNSSNVDSGGYAKPSESTSLKWNIFGDWIHIVPDGTRLWYSVCSDSIWPCASYHRMLNLFTHWYLPVWKSSYYKHKDLIILLFAANEIHIYIECWCSENKECEKIYFDVWKWINIQGGRL